MMTTATTQDQETTQPASEISVAELDQRLEHAIRENERSERLICECLVEMNQREGHKEFGYSDIWDYAEFRFGFSNRKTRYLMELGRKLEQLPQLREAMAAGRIGWTKASKVASVAKPEDEAMWLDSALSLSVRALDRKIREDKDSIGTKVRIWLSDDQAAVWNQAVEVCRKMMGRQAYEGYCLELIAAEFLATYGNLVYREDDCEKEGGEREMQQESEAEAPVLSEECDRAASRDVAVFCPEDGSLPPSAQQPYGETCVQVLERDHYQCSYPGCWSRSNLHVHHIVFRSKTGKKGRAGSNSPKNLLTLCVFHHRMLHSGLIGVKGKAPDRVEWRLPQLMEEALLRSERVPDVRFRSPEAGATAAADASWPTVGSAVS